MLRHPIYTRTRLEQLAARLQARIYPETRPVSNLQVSPRTERIAYHEAQNLDFRPAHIGEQFGPLWATYWFKASATVPPEWNGQRVGNPSLVS